MINIKGLDKALVLKALHDNSIAQGNSFMDLRENLSIDDCKKIIKQYQENFNDLDFDYVEGKVIKCDLSGDDFDPFLYDRDNGHGAAQRAINTITG